MKTTTITCDRCLEETDRITSKNIGGKDRDLCHGCYTEVGTISLMHGHLDDNLIEEWFNNGKDDKWPGFTSIALVHDPISKAMFCRKYQVSRVFLQADFYLGRYRFIEHEIDHATGKTSYEVRDRDVMVGRIQWRKSSTPKKHGPGWEYSCAWDDDEPGVLKWNGPPELPGSIIEVMETLVEHLEQLRRARSWLGNQ